MTEAKVIREFNESALIFYWYQGMTVLATIRRCHEVLIWGLPSAWYDSLEVDRIWWQPTITFSKLLAINLRAHNCEPNALLGSVQLKDKIIRRQKKLAFTCPSPPYCCWVKRFNSDFYKGNGLLWGDFFHEMLVFLDKEIHFVTGFY